MLLVGNIRPKETCPIFPSTASMWHWGFDDLAAVSGTIGNRQKVFRRVRDEIAQHIRQLIDQQ